MLWSTVAKLRARERSDELDAATEKWQIRQIVTSDASAGVAETFEGLGRGDFVHDVSGRETRAIGRKTRKAAKEAHRSMYIVEVPSGDMCTT